MITVYKILDLKVFVIASKHHKRISKMRTFFTKLTKFAMSASMILTAISITPDQLVQPKIQSTKLEIH